MKVTLTRDRTTWLAYLMLAYFGYCLNSLGPITPFLKSELGVSYTVSSLHFTAFALGILGAGLGGHLVIERPCGDDHCHRTAGLDGLPLGVGAFARARATEDQLDRHRRRLPAIADADVAVSARFGIGVEGSRRQRVVNQRIGVILAVEQVVDSGAEGYRPDRVGELEVGYRV